jgi:DNA-binding beta-propeller fold protein YncE
MADEGTCTVHEFNNAGTYQGDLSTTFSGSSGACITGIVFDASGNLWISNGGGNNKIYEISPSNGTILQTLSP